MVKRNHAMKVSPASMMVDLAVTLYPLSRFDITMCYQAFVSFCRTNFRGKPPSCFRLSHPFYGTRTKWGVSRMKLAEVCGKFGMHHGLLLTAAFDKLWVQLRSQENDRQISGKARKTQFDFSSKTESLLGPADVGPPGFSRFWTRR